MLIISKKLERKKITSGRSSLLKRFGRCERGLALVEFALILPVLLTLLAGVIEMTRYIWVNHKILRLSAEVNDLVSQSPGMSANEMNVIFEASEYVMRPFEMGADSLIIVSSVSGTGANPPQVNWRQCGAGSLSVAGSVGLAGSDANIPNGLVLDPLDNIIITEVYYEYKPLIFDSVVEETRLSRVAVHSPRIRSLISILRDAGQSDGC
ncbi:pilus assembly protein [Kiloniella laminariae]|uniref:Pilus assembly protein n=1 Tax=Kiloniella laminariae TaxID=454162 RepID=A0ABT4LIE3_9PROT|nr:TadE/TadG family type IV pilus assembly protein [Kiloniella laminariae]MCZ4280878.1 pilus assembly protein [Kiloniella laminariae]